MSGRLITIDGLDGSGKATQTDLLCRELERRGVRYRRVSFPDYSAQSSAPVRMYLNGEFGDQPGDVNAYAASTFFAVDRFASFARCWKKDYLDGGLIVADRYTTSNMIYQLAKLPKEEWDGFLDWIQDLEYEKLALPRPDLTVYLELPTEISQKLLDHRYEGGKGRKDIHERNLEFLSACRESAAYAARRFSWKTVFCEEGKELRKREEIHEEILKLILEELHVGI
ncbi:Thymidylate kinase [Caprobacter fermentans]|uniref:Thymidylate kinase n=1 Tax=Caproicibacter fermentans TaxID=2576756 RepID=A0A6N8I229_9FIRM|nr:deoxynucleoside kinase [Caproicibacter fermentans]MVB11583.1 Thymidylate kinase [Caproicibacter fermentans]